MKIQYEDTNCWYNFWVFLIHAWIKYLIVGYCIYNIELCKWPGYSPDFNAIELIWNIMKQKIKPKNLKSQDELQNAVDEVLNGYH